MTTNPADDKKKFTAVPNRHTGPVSKVLIANRGEIAVRVIRAARDEGIETVAIYAEPDRDAQHVKLADEAYALNGATAGTSYLVMEKVLEIAIRAGADAVHPGYGFLSENAQFAQMVIDAGLTWIGPSPESITQLGDKVAARHIAQKVGAPLVPGTKDPVESADEVLKFADEFGLPIAIKAAFGGGGRGIKVVRDRNDVIELYESAVREAVAAYGRGECFIERFLDSPRHVETQCLADAHGNVQVVSTRDCSLQRRNQKLIEEAPAPFLSEEQTQRLYEASRAILTEAGYQGAGTCEFLLAPDGTISFLEVNTRLQVEHPVSEEVTGIDLVREQIRIAQGLELTTPPEPRGHSFEFRVTSEDPSKDLTPTAGRLDEVHWPLGPGIRLELGIDQGDSVQTAFDSMIAKIIVTGADREQALARSRRALAEFSVQGVATPVPVYQDIINDPDFCGVGGFNVSTRWFETTFMPQHDYSDLAVPAEASSTADLPRQTYIIELDGRRVSLTLPAGMFNAPSAAAPRPPQPLRSASRRTATSAHQAGSHQGAPGDIVAPMQAIVVALAVADGDQVEEGQLVAVLEAMKMEKPLLAPRAGTVTSLSIKQGDTVTAGTRIAHIATEEEAQ